MKSKTSILLETKPMKWTGYIGVVEASRAGDGGWTITEGTREAVLHRGVETSAESGNMGNNGSCAHEEELETRRCLFAIPDAESHKCIGKRHEKVGCGRHIQTYVPLMGRRQSSFRVDGPDDMPDTESVRVIARDGAVSDLVTHPKLPPIPDDD